MSALIEDVVVACPYCGGVMDVDVDCTGGDQTYYEDCQICCAPIELAIKVDGLGNLLSVCARRDDD